LRGVRSEPDVRMGHAAQRVAVRAGRAARDSAAAVSRSDIQPPEVQPPH
jgi:hypothetical protein